MKNTGTVYLVGAGPGDPELLTLRAARLLQNASLIVHDGLVDRAILALAKPDARLISVAKKRSKHMLPQDQINALLIREARGGRDVVRRARRRDHSAYRRVGLDDLPRTDRAGRRLTAVSRSTTSASP